MLYIKVVRKLMS